MLVANVGPQEFVQTLSYIKTLTYLCLDYDQNMSLSNLCLVFALKIQSLSSPSQDFVLIVQPMPSFCPLIRPELIEKLQDKF